MHKPLWGPVLSLLLDTVESGHLVSTLCQGLPISMYGGTIIPSHPQLADVPGGPLFNGLHNPDPAWNPMIKVIQNSTECTDAQQASLLPSVPALKGEILSPQLTRTKKRVGQPMVASSNQR